MPRVFIEGQEQLLSASSAEGTLGELLTELMASLENSHKLICGIDIDGVSLTEDTLYDAAQRRMAEIGMVVVTTMSYRELYRYGLERAVRLIDEVIREVQQSAEDFRSKPPEEANRSYAACLEDLQLLMDTVAQTVKLQRTFENHGQPAKREVVGSLLHKLADVTGEILLAYRRSDLMVVADVLTYELVPLLNGVHRALQTLQAEMGDRQAQG
jgi:hypothetical protein